MLHVYTRLHVCYNISLGHGQKVSFSSSVHSEAATTAAAAKDM